MATRIMPLKLIPDNTSIRFMKQKLLAFVMSSALIVASLWMIFTQGLNFGIDFTGGVVIEARLPENPDIGYIRSLLSGSLEGEVALQSIGTENDIMIRLQPQEGGQEAQAKTIETVKTILREKVNPAVEYRKVDFVGPQVGNELIHAGALSLGLAVFAILGYIWLRFEWQFGLGAIVALIHDTILTLGFYSLMQIEFNLTSIAAILTIIGYSINDSVVIYDRIRENLRKYKKMPLDELLNVSINDTLSRTILTAGTTVVALVALVTMGGNVIYGFSVAVLFGVIIGTYSSVYIAAPFLVFFNLRREEQH